MKPVHKITILCSRLDQSGGIERIITDLANFLTEKGFKVSLLVLDETAKIFYPVHPAVTLDHLPLYFGVNIKGNKISRKLALLQDIKKLKKRIVEHRPDCIIATDYTHVVATVLTGIQKKASIYFWQQHEHGWIKKNLFWKIMMRYSYPKLDGLICVNETEGKYYRRFVNTIVIPNFSKNISGKRSLLQNKTILTVGWLIPRKGIDYIMTAAKKFFERFPDWQWKIIGDGPMKQELLLFIEKEKLETKLIIQRPVSSDLSDEYANASIFVLASRVEVFGLVLTEAMGHGVPCVSFDCPSGPKNIIKNNEDGILVEKENPYKLADGIIKLAKSESLRKKMGEKAFQNVQRFSPERIYELWRNLF